MSATTGRGTFRALVALCACALGVLLIIPLFALLAGLSPARALGGLASEGARASLLLSLWTTFASMAIVVALGTPLAWALSQRRDRFAGWLEIALALPAVVPPAVAGVALLLAFGRRGALGALWPGDGIAFTPLAVVLAQVFVAAPFYVQAAIAAFRRIAPQRIALVRSLGAGPFALLRHLALPFARPGLLAGAAMAWARALGEFGATLMFAGSLAGSTQTLPLLIYAALEADPAAAQALSALLVLVALGVLLLARALLPPAQEAARG